jgi:hypothetical protein
MDIPQSPPSERRAGLRWWFLCAVGFSLLYILTCQRGVGWQDSGLLQYRVWTGDYQGRLGLALAHPLYIAAGRVLLWLTGRHLALAMNAFTGVGTAVALANLAGLVTFLSGRRWIGITTAAILAVTHTVWWLSTITEAGYTWSLAGLTAELWLLAHLIRRPTWRRLAILGLVNGLGLCVHNFALLPLPIYAVTAVALVVRKRLPPWSLAIALAAYLLGAAYYLTMVFGLAVSSGDVLGAVRSALFGNYAREVLNASSVSRFARANLALAMMNVASPIVPLAIVGWVHFRRFLGSALAAALAGITLIELAFVVRYPVPDQFMFLLPSLLMIALSAGVGVAVLSEKSARLRRIAIAACLLCVAIPPALYAASPSLVRATGMETRRSRVLPFRDELRYWLVPWKHNEDSAERFAQAAMEQASPDGVIIPDGTTEETLSFVQLRDGRWPSVQVQFRGHPLPNYDRDPEAFRRTLDRRRLLLVAPTSRQLGKQFLQDVEISQQESQVLHEARWKDAPHMVDPIPAPTTTNAALP